MSRLNRTIEVSSNLFDGKGTNSTRVRKLQALQKLGLVDKSFRFQGLADNGALQAIEQHVLPKARTDDTRPEPKQYSKSITFNDQTCVVLLNVARSGLIKAQVQMPDLSIWPVGSHFFQTEDKAITAATRKAQDVFATNPNTIPSEEPAR